MRNELITGIDDLKKRATRNPETDDWMECFIALNGGARSSKRIMYYPETGTFDVHNEIDDTYLEDMTVEDLGKKTHILEAIKKRAIFEYDYSVKK